MAVVGQADRSKRIEQLILAIGASPILRQSCRVRVIGHATAEECERLNTYAKAVAVEPPEFTGWISDEDLRWRIRDVDVICCLRYPALAEASVSVILALASGRPVLVSNHDCYAEMPEGTVLHCSPGAEALDVMRHLEDLMADCAAGRAVDERAQALVVQRHSPSAYADALLPLLQQVIRERPLMAARQRLCETLSELGLSRHDPVMCRIDAVLSKLRSV